MMTSVSEFSHSLDVFLLQRSYYDVDLLGFTVIHHESLIDFNTADTTVKQDSVTLLFFLGKTLNLVAKLCNNNVT